MLFSKGATGAKSDVTEAKTRDACVRDLESAMRNLAVMMETIRLMGT